MLTLSNKTNLSFVPFKHNHCSVICILLELLVYGISKTKRPSFVLAVPCKCSNVAGTCIVSRLSVWFVHWVFNNRAPRMCWCFRFKNTVSSPHGTDDANDMQQFITRGVGGSRTLLCTFSCRNSLATTTEQQASLNYCSWYHFFILH